MGRAGDFSTGNMYNLVLKLFGRSDTRFENDIQINVTDVM